MILNKNNFVHSDLKSENILLSNDCQLKIIDFGSTLHESQVASSLVVTTPEYLSPEALNYLANPTDPATMNLLLSNLEVIDIWSFGIVLLELMIGFPVYMAYRGRVVGQKAISEA